MKMLKFVSVTGIFIEHLSEWVEPYGLTQYIIFITNINIHMRSLLGEVAGAWLLAKQNCLTRHYSL
jgi:hypothetical protein